MADTIKIVALLAGLGRFLTLREDYGAFQALILLFLFPDARRVMDRIEKHLLRAESKNAMVMKKALADDCTMLAVAAAIVAQIAITAMSLGSSDRIHWTANAAFAVSLVTASLSVSYACLLQQHVSGLFTAEDVKSWLSKPASPWELKELDKLTSQWQHNLRAQEGDPESGSEGMRSQIEDLRKEIENFARKYRWKTASFNAAFMIKVPSLLLNLSVGTFLIGLGIYLGCSWMPDLHGSRPSDGTLGVLVFYIVTTIGGLLLYFVPATCKFFEMLPLKLLDLSINSEGDSAKPRFEAMFASPDVPAMESLDRHGQSNVHQPSPSTTWHVSPLASDTVSKSPGDDSDDTVQRHAQDGATRDQATDTSDCAEAQHGKPDQKLPPSINFASAVPSSCDPLVSALRASIEAQERSTLALRAVLDAHLATLAVKQAADSYDSCKLDDP